MREAIKECIIEETEDNSDYELELELEMEPDIEVGQFMQKTVSLKPDSNNVFLTVPDSKRVFP